MSIQEETYRILGQRLLTDFNSKKYVDWAVNLLSTGLESESLIILAGLDNDSTQEREKYFWKTITELKIEINKSDFDLIENYALYIARQVVSGKFNALEALNEMQKVVLKTDYNSKYIQFMNLDEDIDYLNSQGSTIFNSGLKKDKIEQFVKTEFELFLETESINIDSETREKSICDKCNMIVKPKLKTKHKFLSPQSYQIWVCGNCGSEKIEHFSSQTGKRKIIERLKK